MKFSELKKYFGIFILAAAVIIVYKTFDNIGVIFSGIGTAIGLLTPFIIGGVIAFVLSTPCQKLELLLKRTKISFLKKHRRGLAILLIYAAVVLIITFIMVIIIPQLVDSIKKFVDQLPQMIQSLGSWVGSFSFLEDTSFDVGKFLSDNLLSLDKFATLLDLNNLDKYAKGVASFGSSVFDFFIGIIVSIYMLSGRKNIRHAAARFCRAFIPNKQTEVVTFYVKKISNFIKKYIGCQILDSCIVFMLCLIVLSIMNTEYASVIALMVGSFNLIPYFGAIIAVFISALITLVTGGFMNAIILVVVLIVIQQLDANLVQPRLVANSLAIKPLLVIFGVVIGGGLFGIFGMFLGVPIVALFNSIISDLISKKNAEKQARASE